jgi:hypothetical protein
MNTRATSSEITSGVTSFGRSGWRVRLSALLKKQALDRRLIEGESPQASPELSRRAALLLDPDERHEVAEAIRQTVTASLEPQRGPSSKVSLNRAGIETARKELDELGATLDGGAPVTPRGVAMARHLVTDMASPLYCESASETLAEAARHARIAMLLR